MLILSLLFVLLYIDNIIFMADVPLSFFLVIRPSCFVFTSCCALIIFFYSLCLCFTLGILTVIAKPTTSKLCNNTLPSCNLILFGYNRIKWIAIYTIKITRYSLIRTIFSTVPYITHKQSIEIPQITQQGM